MTVQVVDDPEICFALRHQVFVEEQGVPFEEEQDALDASATHLLAFDGDRPIGAARVIFVGDVAKIGRVCVLSDARGTGLGVALIEKAINVARQHGAKKVKLGAQTQAIGFYDKLGFRPVGSVYDDAGLPHQDMEMALS